MTQSLSPELERKASNVRALLEQGVAAFGDVVYASSLGLEAMVLTDIIWTQVPGIEIFSIDTGRLHEETYSLLDRVQRRYGKRIRVYYPQAEMVESFVVQHGINGFYSGVDERLSCCHVRKVEPFRRAIAGRRAWITGVRRQQSAQRAEGQPVEWDGENGLYRISPLLDWTQAEVQEYVQALKLPYNPLHDRSFPSIGCAPCTRAIEAGQDSRAGRWWWENSESRECGLQPRIRVVATAAAR
jgi:phosphoadenosine phosphosulfate reductase